MKNSYPLVCICIPTYNSEKTIGRTIESLLIQNYKNFHIKIVDNCSIDSTIKIIESFQDPRIKIYPYYDTVSVDVSFNRCISLMDGAYSAIFHADDIYLPNMLSDQVDFLENNLNVGAVFTEAILIDGFDKTIGCIKLPHGISVKKDQYDFIHIFKKILNHYNFIVCPSAMVRTHIYKYEIVEWNGQEFRSSADLDVWLRILKRHSISFLGPLMKLRISPSQETEKERKNLNRADFFSVIDYYLSLNDVKTLISQNDIESYQWLERRDKLKRYINHLSSGQSVSTKEFFYGNWRLRSIIKAFNTKQGVLTLLFGSMIILSTSCLSKNLSNKLIISFSKILHID